MNICTAKQH